VRSPHTRLVSRSAGVGLVELLIALAVGGIILGVAAAFYGQQARVTRETQARNDLNVRGRAVLEAVVQDVRMAGARAAVDDSGRTAFRRSLPCDADDECIVVDLAGGDVERLQVQYVSSLFLEGAAQGGVDGVVPSVCRTVTYEFAGGTLFRSDVECGVAALPNGFATEFARDVERLELAFVCGDGGLEEDARDCFGEPLGFVREARVGVTVGSARVADLRLELSSATVTPNMRSFDRFVEVGE
jgi:hypothetical protein